MEILGGPLFGVAGAGESHGPAVVTIVFGCPAGLRVSRSDLQHDLDRRRPGGSRHGTARREQDRVVILSGLCDPEDEKWLQGPQVAVAGDPGGGETVSYEQGFTTGEPIAALVLSTSKRSSDYARFEGSQGDVRPGHTDLVKYAKSRGFVDVRGGGRSSYRSTISDVIGGSVARLFLKEQFGTVIFSSISRVGPLVASQLLDGELMRLVKKAKGGPIASADLEAIGKRLDVSPIRCLDRDFAEKAVDLIAETRRQGDSLGAVLEVAAANVPPLLGEPIYQSLKLRLMGSLGGLHAAQSCEVGAGLGAASSLGSENNDPIRKEGYQSNRHGGLIGGVTTGMPLLMRVGFKPTSSIRLPQRSVRKDGREIDFQLKKGRHDPCVAVRAGVTLESRMAIEVANAVLMHQAGSVDTSRFRLFEDGT